MSDEFIRVATQEINDELKAISKILESCSKDSDISKNVKSIQKHIHKIKGLAPMMGKPEIGEISSLNDALLKYIMDGNTLDDVFDVLSESNTFMKNSMKGSNSNYKKLKQKIKTKYSRILK